MNGLGLLERISGAQDGMKITMKMEMVLWIGQGLEMHIGN
jgi:hypothetical protein